MDITEWETDYRPRLTADFPELQIKSIKLLGEGWDHVATEVNGSVIFRTPRGVYNQEKLATSVRYETAILNLPQGKLPAEIPDPLFIAPRDAYFGYRKLPGIVQVSLVNDFNQEDTRHMLEDWVAVAHGIHMGIPVGYAEKLGVPKFDAVGLIRVAKEVYDLVKLSESMKAFVDKVIDEASGVDMINERPYFIHNDLHLLNILADPTTKRITGVIDWSDCCIAPLAREFAVWEWSHDDTLEEVAMLYEKKSGINVDVKQARIWKHIEEVSDLVEQTKSGDAEGVASSLLHIDKWIAEGKWLK